MIIVKYEFIEAVNDEVFTVINGGCVYYIHVGAIKADDYAIAGMKKTMLFCLSFIEKEFLLHWLL